MKPQCQAVIAFDALTVYQCHHPRHDDDYHCHWIGGPEPRDTTLPKLTWFDHAKGATSDPSRNPRRNHPGS